MNDSMTRFNLEIILNSSFLRVSGVLGVITGQPSILCNDTVDKPRSVINPATDFRPRATRASSPI